MIENMCAHTHILLGTVFVKASLFRHNLILNISIVKKKKKKKKFTLTKTFVIKSRFHCHQSYGMKFVNNPPPSQIHFPKRYFFFNGIKNLIEFNSFGKLTDW